MNSSVVSLSDFISMLPIFQIGLVNFFIFIIIFFMVVFILLKKFNRFVKETDQEINKTKENVNCNFITNTDNTSNLKTSEYDELESKKQVGVKNTVIETTDNHNISHRRVFED